jgi:hypothetical protein
MREAAPSATGTSRRRLQPLAGVVVLAGVVAAGAQAPRMELFSKRFEFKAGVTLDIAELHPAGLRLDSVTFDLPVVEGDRVLRTGGLVTARVAVSNTGPEPRRVGLAIALMDDDGRLLGVAGGGSKLAPIKPERQKVFSLVFDGVNTEAHRAKAFQISMEPKP